MDLSTLSPGKRQNRKRVGRGPSSGKGKTCGRGHKGQKARSGYARKPGFEGGQMPLMRRVPKRGFTHAARHPLAQINLDVLDKAFDNGDEVTQAALMEKGLCKKQYRGVKVLGRGELSKPLTLTVNAISDAARKKVEEAGGTVNLIEAPKPNSVTKRRAKHA